MFHSLVTQHSLLVEPYLLKHQPVIHVSIFYLAVLTLKTSISILKATMLEMQAVCFMEAILIPVSHNHVYIIQHTCMHSIKSPQSIYITGII